MLKPIAWALLLPLAAWAKPSPYRDASCQVFFPGNFIRGEYAVSHVRPHLQLYLLSWPRILVLDAEYALHCCPDSLWLILGSRIQRKIGWVETMLRLAVMFFIVALLAWMFGFGGVAALSAGIGKSLLGVFLIVAVLGLLFFGGLFSRA